MVAIILGKLLISQNMTWVPLFFNLLKFLVLYFVSSSSSSFLFSFWFGNISDSFHHTLTYALAHRYSFEANILFMIFILLSTLSTLSSLFNIFGFLILNLWVLRLMDNLFQSHNYIIIPTG